MTSLSYDWKQPLSRCHTLGSPVQQDPWLDHLSRLKRSKLERQPAQEVVVDLLCLQSLPRHPLRDQQSTSGTDGGDAQRVQDACVAHEAQDMWLLFVDLDDGVAKDTAGG